MKHLTYQSPMTHKYVEVGELLMDGPAIAHMASTDDFIADEIATFKCGSDGGGLQMEIDEIGRVLAAAPIGYELANEILRACDPGTGREISDITRQEIEPLRKLAAKFMAAAKGE